MSESTPLSKVAVLLVPGSAKSDPEFGQEFRATVAERFEKEIGRPEALDQLVFEVVSWPTLFAPRLEDLWFRLTAGPTLAYHDLRQFMLHFAASAAAYQDRGRQSEIYWDVHSAFVDALARLRERAGPSAALCVVAHGLGCVMASNFLWDLQHARGRANDSPLERGETLALLTTMGSPQSLWGLGYPDFGEPIAFPAPALDRHYPRVWTQWQNLFDKDDVLAFPLQTLNDRYARVVLDREVNVGGFLTGNTPASHAFYWADAAVARLVAGDIAHLWLGMNEELLVAPTPAE